MGKAELELRGNSSEAGISYWERASLWNANEFNLCMCRASCQSEKNKVNISFTQVFLTVQPEGMCESVRP